MKELFATKKNLLLYFLQAFIIVSLVLYIFIYDLTTDSRLQTSAQKVSTWDDYTVVSSLSKTVISGSIPVDPTIGNTLVFYTIHQSVEIYLDGDLLYQYPVDNNNKFSKSAGYAWNFVDLPNPVNNVQIVIKSPYSKYIEDLPEFYIGNELSVLSLIIRDNMVPFLVCITMCIFGIVLIVYHYALTHTTSSTGKLFRLGILSILISLWAANDCHVTTLLLRNNLVTSYSSFLMLILLPYPLSAFIQSFYDDPHPIWDSLHKFNLFQMAFCLLMMFFGLYDLRNTMWTTYVVFAAVIIVTIIQSFRYKNDKIRSHNVSTHVICGCICLVFVSLDFISASANLSDTYIFTKLGFLVYILFLGLSSMRESLELMKKGQEASAYQKLAYTDQMTGLNNRTCFNKDFELMSHNPIDVAVIDFDLNNLKKTNDTYGHSAGDKYIITCSTIIREIFDGVGKCYRVGGDEFVALIEKASNVDLTYYFAMLESSVDNANKSVDKFKMAIAYGCTTFDPNLDKNLEDTYNRADKIMYKNKEEKKAIHRR